MSLTLRRRCLIEINTDPQRRCYNGCHAKSELVWTQWTVLDSNVKPEKVESILKFWRELNDYAVSQRGKVNTLCEFEVLNIEESPNAM